MFRGRRCKITNLAREFCDEDGEVELIVIFGLVVDESLHGHVVVMRGDHVDLETCKNKFSSHSAKRKN